MKTRLLHDKKQIEEFLRRDPYLHIYALGDLDDFFWPHTTWHALCEDGSIGQIALVYSGAPLPVLLGFASDPVDGMRELLASAAHLLPPRLYAHLSPGTAPALAGHFRIRYHGTYLKMAWTDRSRVDLVDTTDVVSLSSADWREVQAFYAESYPGNWFDPRILATGACRGLRSEGRLVSVAGVHVFSPAYGAAALGNIATHPRYRGRGLATTTTGSLCRALPGSITHVGLNVKADNEAAIACYQRLGFERIATYEELDLEWRCGTPGEPADSL